MAMFATHALREWVWPTWSTFTEYCENSKRAKLINFFSTWDVSRPHHHHLQVIYNQI